MFLSSLHCTDEDHSLLDDCAHSQLGLAVCDEDSGLAGAKCLGEEGSYYIYTGVTSVCTDIPNKALTTRLDTHCLSRYQ